MDPTLKFLSFYALAGVLFLIFVIYYDDSYSLREWWQRFTRKGKNSLLFSIIDSLDAGKATLTKKPYNFVTGDSVIVIEYNGDEYQLCFKPIYGETLRGCTDEIEFVLSYRIDRDYKEYAPIETLTLNREYGKDLLRKIKIYKTTKSTFD